MSTNIGKTLLVMLLMAGLVISGCSSTGGGSKSMSRQDARQEMDPLLRSRLDLAAEYLRKGNHVGARDHLQKALTIDRSEPEIYDLMALMYYKELEYDLAEENYRKAISVDRYFTRGYNNLGSFLYARERYDEACEMFEKAASDVDYILRSSVFVKLGQCQLMQGNREGAEQSFQKAVALNPQMSYVYLELAQMAFEDKDFPRAKNYWNYYDGLKRQPSAKGLWLGVRLEHEFGNLDARDSRGLALTKLFPDSKETLEYKKWLQNGYKDRNP